MASKTYEDYKREFAAAVDAAGEQDMIVLPGVWIRMKWEEDHDVDPWDPHFAALAAAEPDPYLRYLLSPEASEMILGQRPWPNEDGDRAHWAVWMGLGGLFGTIE